MLVSMPTDQRLYSLHATMWDQLTTRLNGQIVVLEPLAARHEEGLFAALTPARMRLRMKGSSHICGVSGAGRHVLPLL